MFNPTAKHLALTTNAEIPAIDPAYQSCLLNLTSQPIEPFKQPCLQALSQLGQLAAAGQFLRGGSSQYNQFEFNPPSLTLVLGSFIAGETDNLCDTAILIEILRSDGIPHTINYAEPIQICRYDIL